MSTVLVCGSTGRFREITPRLLERGHAVRAATRDPGSPAARDLRRRGATVVDADLDDVAGLRAAAEGADVVFAGGTAHAAGPQADARHGTNVAEAARDAGVSLLVYVSVAGADRPSGVPVFESKRAVEARIHRLRVPATIVAPVYLMENLWNPWNLPALEAGRLPTPVPGTQRMKQVALADVIAVAALVIEREDELVGQRVPVASDELTAHEAAAALSRLIDAPLAVQEPPSPPANPLFRWLEEVGDHVDIDGLRACFPDVGWHWFADWAATQDLDAIRSAAAADRR